MSNADNLRNIRFKDIFDVLNFTSDPISSDTTKIKYFERYSNAVSSTLSLSQENFLEALSETNLEIEEIKTEIQAYLFDLLKSCCKDNYTPEDLKTYINSHINLSYAFPKKSYLEKKFKNLMSQDFSIDDALNACFDIVHRYITYYDANCRNVVATLFYHDDSFSQTEDSIKNSIKNLVYPDILISSLIHFRAHQTDLIKSYKLDEIRTCLDIDGVEIISSTNFSTYFKDFREEEEYEYLRNLFLQRLSKENAYSIGTHYPHLLFIMIKERTTLANIIKEPTLNTDKNLMNSYKDLLQKFNQQWETADSTEKFLALEEYYILEVLFRIQSRLLTFNYIYNTDKNTNATNTLNSSKRGLLFDLEGFSPIIIQQEKLYYLITNHLEKGIASEYSEKFDEVFNEIINNIMVFYFIFLRWLFCTYLQRKFTQTEQLLEELNNSSFLTRDTGSALLNSLKNLSNSPENLRTRYKKAIVTNFNTFFYKNNYPYNLSLKNSPFLQNSTRTKSHQPEK